MAQETAVEWLEAKLKNIDYTTIDTSNFITCKIALHTFNKLWEQAKQMEKEQIINARRNGFEQSHDRFYFQESEGLNEQIDYELNSEQYYNETFKK